MGRTALPRKRIYRETVEEIIKKNGIKKTDFCEAMGHTSGWFATTLTKGYYDISVAGLRLLALALGCTEDELTALPVSPEGQKAASISPNGNNLDDVLSEIQALTAEVAMGFKTAEKDRPTETKQDELYDLVRSVGYQCGQRMVRLYRDEYQYKGHVLVNRKIRQYKEVRFCGWNCMRAFERGEQRKVEEDENK